MLIFSFQISTIVFMLLLFLTMLKTEKRERRKEEEAEDICWNIKTFRVGKARKTFAYYFMPPGKLKDEIGLQTGVYVLGNGLFNDIYLDSAGDRTKIYLNVQRDKIYLTVLKGHIVMQSYRYEANAKEMIMLEDMSRTEIGDVMLQFCKRRVV